MQYLQRTSVPQPQSPRPFNFPSFERYRLANGLDILLAEDHTLPLISLHAGIKAPAQQDSPGQEGLSYALCELLPEGTESRDSQQIANELEFLGVNYSTHLDWNLLNLEMNCLQRHLDQTFNIFCDMLLNPALPQNEFTRVQRETLAERMRTIDSPSRLAAEMFVRRLYGRHRYAIPLEGRQETIEKITRQGVARMFQHVARPENTLLIIVGDFKCQEMLRRLKSVFDDWPAGTVAQLPPFEYDQPEEVRVTIVHKPGAVQSELRLGHIGTERSNPDYFKLAMMNEILGGYFLSRINQKLREERGFTYGASSAFSFRPGRGPFYVSTSVDGRYTAEAIADIIDEMRRMQQDKVSEQELVQARGYFSGVFPIAFETADQIALGLTNIAVFDLPEDYYRSFRDNITRVSREDILEAARNYLHPDRLHIVVAGDKDVVREQLQQHYELEIFDQHGNKLD